MSLAAKNRYQAFGYHFLISLLIVSSFTYLIFFHWYPEPYFSADGGWSVFRMVIIVDLMIGPMLTLIIYKPGKKGLKFDLSAIAIAQISALLYGGSVLYLEKPAYLTFAVDRFVIVSADDIDSSKFPDKTLLEETSESPRLVFALMPEDRDERDKLISEVMTGKPDLEFRPEYYHSFKKYLSVVLYNKTDTEQLKKQSPEHAEKIDQFINDNCKDGCSFFPLVGKKSEVLLAISSKDGHVIGGIDIDPWLK